MRPANDNRNTNPQIVPSRSAAKTDEALSLPVASSVAHSAWTPWQVSRAPEFIGYEMGVPFQ